MDVLRRALQENQGEMPARKVRQEIAQGLDLKENQVYKWFWEIIKKQTSVEQGFNEAIDDFESAARQTKWIGELTDV